MAIRPVRPTTTTGTTIPGLGLQKPRPRKRKPLGLTLRTSRTALLPPAQRALLFRTVDDRRRAALRLMRAGRMY